jgi:DNA polymerase-1
MVYLIDASIYVFRAWFSIPDDMIDAEQNPVNAVYGFARFLSDFLESVQPVYVAAAFDESQSTSFRNEIYPAYKANRDPAPAELKRQFLQCRDLTRALGIMDCADTGYEADDLIGTLAAGGRQAGHPVTIVSRDKDFYQVLQEGDRLWDYAGNKTVHYHQVPDALGVRAEQVVDYLALAGDSVDNIPGARGVGAKTAAALLGHFESVDDLYDNLERVVDVPVRGAGKLGARLAEHKDAVNISRDLARIRYDAPVDASESSLARRRPDLVGLNKFYDGVGFGTALRRQAQRIDDTY